jgi:DNA polymerase I-like protein with 3'-5' exonuclease and polymerase domains
MFTPDLGARRLIKFDYSQIEYRFLIHFAVGPGADEARAKFCAHPDTDYHKWTQGLVEAAFGRTIDRRPIKNLNFGIIYGMGEAKLTADLNLKSEKEARAFLETYHKGVPFAKPTMDACMKEANQYGIITTVLGRRSRFDLWEPRKWGTEGVGLPYEMALLRYGDIRRAYIHKALNRRLQGSAADQMKVAMYRCWKDGVFSYTGVPRLTVHDELDFSDPGGRDDGFREIKRIMESAIPLRIPVRVDVEGGPNWGEVEELKDI